MTEITIDYNNDTLRIRNKDGQVEIPIMGFGSMGQIRHIIESILDSIELSNVTLLKEDEDKRVVIGEW